MESVRKILMLAEYHSGKNSSAVVCYRDAYTLWRENSFRYACIRALKSLAYSVGMYHADYVKCKEIFETTEILDICFAYDRNAT